MSSVYVFEGNPYQQTNALAVGTLELSKGSDGVPIHTTGLRVCVLLVFMVIPAAAYK